jgi:putative zinc finger/helix-turn-helix YgiT family protein
MKCRVCKDAPELFEVREDYLYRECGMDNVTIMGITVRKCPVCGSLMPVIPCIEGLHDALAHAIVKKDSQLTPQEIVFLRKSLGWSGVDFAKNMGCDKAQISKWEHGAVKMSKPYELLLREIAASGKKISDYQRQEIVWKAPPSSRPLQFRLQRAVWKEAA